MTKTKSLLLAAGIVLATAFTLCSCKEEAKPATKQQTAIMPSQSFVGTWRGEGVDYDNSYITIQNIFNEDDHKEVDFVWYIVNRISAAAIANIKDGKIVFITRDESEHTGEEYHRISGTMEFNENGVSLTVEESKDSDIIAGQTFHYKNKKQ